LLVGDEASFAGKYSIENGYDSYQDERSRGEHTQGKGV